MSIGHIFLIILIWWGVRIAIVLLPLVLLAAGFPIWFLYQCLKQKFGFRQHSKGRS